MTEEKITAERLSAFSDAVFAVIVTIMVLELEAPEEAAADLDQFCAPVPGVLAAFRDSMGRPHGARLVANGGLRRIVRVHRHRLQRLRAPGAGRRRQS
jgi:hypothetical protein